MDSIYKVLYGIGGAVILISLLGGSLFSTSFINLSKSTLSMGGVKEEYVSAVDDKIDNIFHLGKRLEYRLEQLKTLFSKDKPDEADYAKEKNYLIRGSLYDPLVNIVKMFYRATFFGFGIMVLMFGVIFHILNKFFIYRDRVNILEARLYEIEKSFLLSNRV